MWLTHISWRTVQRRERFWYTKIYVKAYHVDMKKEITHTRWSMEVVTLRDDELPCRTKAIYYITWQKLYLKNKLMCCSIAILQWHVLEGITTYQLPWGFVLVVRDETKPTKELTEGGDLREDVGRRLSICLAIPALTASLGAKTRYTITGVVLTLTNSRRGWRHRCGESEGHFSRANRPYTGA